MNGVHDMGGMHGFGPVDRTETGSPFHAPWEGRVQAMMRTLIRRGVFNLDEMRRAIESIPPAQYLASTYFERWLAALRMLLEEKGVLTPAEIEGVLQQLQDGPARTRPPRRPTAPAAAEALPQKPAPPPAATAPRFRPGDRVVAKNQHVKGHTRLPRYVRGKRGIVHQVRGVYDFPDTKAHGRGAHPAPVYSVRFAAPELWGDTASAGDSVYIDLWENYLDPV